MSNKKIDLEDPNFLDFQVKKFQKELNSGTVSLVLLAILRNASAPMYGYEIAKMLPKNNGGKQGAIYPVLRNLHAKGLIDCNVASSETGPPRKYFEISTIGSLVLHEWIKNWRTTQDQVNNILDGKM